jgi:hypothetical protein
MSGAEFRIECSQEKYAQLVHRGLVTSIGLTSVGCTFVKAILAALSGELS